MSSAFLDCINISIVWESRIFITQLVKTYRYSIKRYRGSYRVETRDQEKKKEESEKKGYWDWMLDAFETDRQSPSSYWRHVRDSRRASLWKRSHPGGGLYSNREGESRPRRGATSSRNKYVSPSVGPYILRISARVLHPWRWAYLRLLTRARLTN